MTSETLNTLSFEMSFRRCPDNLHVLSLFSQVSVPMLTQIEINQMDAGTSLSPIQ